MRIPVLYVLLWFAAGPDPGGVRIEPPAVDPRRPDPLTVAAEPPILSIQPGDPAPDFSFVGLDGRWRSLRDLTAHGALLLVVAPHQAQLRALDRARDSLLDIGVLPVAVLDVRPNRARLLVQQLGLRYTVVPDARRIVASQLDSVHPLTLAPVPSWFLVDRTRKVRALKRGVRLERDFASLAARALALPLPDAVPPAGR
jgi:peroxiredoxin